MDDLTEDRTIDEHDALMMYYAYEFSDLSGMVGHQALRTLLLNGLASLMNPIDTDYRELVRQATD